MEEVKISVIVPVYKVEPYLRKCLDSILGQTYRDLEIVLVDDGSPDNCGAICDEYAAGDERIKVIHKENGGLSSARNAALDIVTGDYIGFVDSDDWVELDMFEYLLSGIQRHHADIAVCGMTEVYPDDQKEISWDRELVLNTEQAIAALLGPEPMENYVCNKLWKKELFQTIRFPVGCNYEDIATTYRLFELADKIVCLPLCKYLYLQRTDSIVGGRSLKNKLDYYEMSRQRYDVLKETWPQFKSELEAQCMNSAVSLWASYYAGSKEEQRENKDRMVAISAFARVHRDGVLQHTGLGLAGRMVLWLTPYAKPWAFALAQLVSKLYEWKHGRPL